MFDGRITNAPHVPRPRALREARALVRNPVEVMEKYLRERAFNGYGADVVWLYNTMISGVEVVGYGIAYKCT